MELFKEDKLSVIYGRNGSGKTTIAKRIAELVMPEEERNNDFEVSTDDIAIGPEQKKNVFVFDEDFVTNQVRIRKDGIDTIVMMGEQAELDKMISDKKENLVKINRELSELQTQRDKYDNASDSISPLYYFNKIRDGLREDGGWADIDRRLRGNTLKSRVTNDVVYELMGIDEPKASYEYIRKHLHADLSLYLKSKNAESITWKVYSVGRPENLYAVNAILKQPLDSPKLSEREERLMNAVVESSHYQWHFSQQNTKQLLNDEWMFCPLCLREIQKQDRTDIAETLTHILNREADEYDKQLTNLFSDFAALEIEMPDFPGSLSEGEINAAKIALQKFNRVLASVRSRIEQRKRNLYNQILEPFTDGEIKDYEDVLSELKQSLTTLTKCVHAFNDSVNERNKLYERIRVQNKILARKHLAALLSDFRRAEENSNKNKKALERKTVERNKVNDEINRLTAQKERIDIALSYINNELNYVFYSNRKLQLVASDNSKKYKLQVNGKSVSPEKISVGERNVLALCYFFATLFSGKEDKKRYNSELLIVIDDPVSSFDYGNRLGVMTLLRFQFDRIFNGNGNSRILVMSHDMHSVFDLLKIRNELCADTVKNRKKVYLELENKHLAVRQKDGEYWKLLHHVYEYAITEPDAAEDPDDNMETSIGNVMRRLLEAFSTFCYACPFEKMLRMKDLLTMIPPEKQDYYGNFMCRLALNGESHAEEAVYSLETVCNFFSKKEKVQTAKSVLLFLCYVNRPHLASYLKDEIPIIESWQSEESKWIK